MYKQNSIKQPRNQTENIVVQWTNLSISTMNFRLATLLLLASAATGGDAFSVGPTVPFPAGAATDLAGTGERTSTGKKTAFLSAASRRRSSTSSALHASSDTIWGGEPTERARSTIDQRQVIRTLPVSSLKGDKVSFDALIGTPTKNDNKTSIVVFLRSLG